MLATGLTGRFGPNGKRTPLFTPAYSTVASAQVTGIAALQTALNSASSGQVIEYTPSPGADTGTKILTGGSPLDGSNNLTWASNVLVRPPLGTRATLPTTLFSIEARGVVVAGYNWGAGTIQTDNSADTYNGARSGFWRMLGTHPDSYFRTVATDDSQWIEVVVAKRRYGMTSLSNEDRCNVLSHNNRDCNRARLVGCYIAGSVGGPRPVTAESNTVGPVNAQTVLNYTHSGANVTIDSITTGCPKIPAGASITVAYKVNGVTKVTHTVPATAINVSGQAWGVGPNNDFGKDEGATLFTLTAGDVLTATVTALTGTVPSLYCGVGVSSGLHEDTFQSFVSNGGNGQIKGLVVASTFLDDCDNSSAQVEGMGEDITWYNNWNGSQRSYTMDLNDLLSNGHASRWHFYRNVWIGKGPTIDANFVYAMKYNVWQAAPVWRAGSFTPDLTNVLNPTYTSVRPALPDLSVVWPECPYVGDPT